MRTHTHACKIALAVLLAVISIEARATVLMSKCPNSNEVAWRNHSNAWPRELVRAEVVIQGGKEVVLSPTDMIDPRPDKYDMHLVARALNIQSRPGWWRNGPPADGRYIVVGLYNPTRHSPASREREQSCFGNVLPQHEKLFIADPLAAKQCAGSCSDIKDDDLLDLVYDQPKRMRFVFRNGEVSTPRRWNDRLWGTAPVAVRTIRMFDLDEQTRIGVDSRDFHPEEFQMEADVRTPKADLWWSDPRGGTFMLTSIVRVQACPRGNTISSCAPQEAVSRRTRTAPVPEGFGNPGFNQRHRSISPLAILALLLPLSIGLLVWRLRSAQ